MQIICDNDGDDGEISDESCAPLQTDLSELEGFENNVIEDENSVEISVGKIIENEEPKSINEDQVHNIIEENDIEVSVDKIIEDEKIIIEEVTNSSKSIDDEQNPDSRSIIESSSEDLNVSDDDLSGNEDVTSESFDIGYLENKLVTEALINQYVRQGPSAHPLIFPSDGNRNFPINILRKVLKNGEIVERDWLVWSKHLNCLFCFPCKLFTKNNHAKTTKLICGGFSKSSTWKKLYRCVPEHEQSRLHKINYLQWKEAEVRINQKQEINELLDSQIDSRVKYWQLILKRILSVVLFLGIRSLAFRGISNRIGDVNNGNFLGLIELLSQFDPILEEHVEKVRQSQLIERSRLQVHYLSSDSQNEFIDICGNKVLSEVLNEREKAKYFSIMVDGTPDNSHIEQNTFIVRYVLEESKQFKIKERFIRYVDCNKKTGKRKK